MAGQVDTTISLQMQADTKQAQADLSKVAASFQELTKQVAQINVNLIGLTPATQEFLKNLQGVALSAGSSKESLSKLATVDVQAAFAKGTQSSVDLDKQLVVLSKDATGAYTNLATVGTQTSTTAKSFDQFTSGASGVSSQVEVMRQGFGALIAMQQEQTKALHDLSVAMQNYRQAGNQNNEETKSWRSTIVGWARDVGIVLFALKSLGEAWDKLTGKETAEQKSLREHTAALKDNTLALRGEAAQATELSQAHEPLEDSLKRTGFHTSVLRIGLLGLSESGIIGAAAFAKVAASLSGVGLAFSAASLAVTAYKLGWDGSLQAIQDKINVFDSYVFKLADTVESGLKKASKSFRESVQSIGQSVDDSAGKIDEFKSNVASSGSVIEGIYDTFKGLPSLFSSIGSGISNSFRGMVDSLITRWDAWVESFSGNAVMWPTLMKPLTQAETDFLQEHVKNWDKIKTVTDEYTEKFKTEMPQNMRRAYLEMRTGVQGEIFSMIELAAAAGKSFGQLSKELKEKFGAELSGNLGVQFAKMSSQIHGDLQKVAGDIAYVVPLKEQLANAGNISAEKTLEITKKYNQDIAEQKKQIDALAVSTVAMTDKQAAESKTKLQAAEDGLRYAQGMLEQAKNSNTSAKELRTLEAGVKSWQGTVKDAKANYDKYGKSVTDQSAAIKKSVDDAGESAKKQTESMINFSQSLGSTLGVSASKMAEMLQTQFAGDSKITANWNEVISKNSAKEAAINSFREKVIQGSFTSKEEIVGVAKEAAASLGGTSEDQVKFMGELFKTSQSTMKEIIDAENKAAQESVKTMNTAVTEGFNAMKRQSAEAFEAANKDIKSNEEAWKESQQANKETLLLSETSFDAYAQSFKTHITELSGQTSQRMGEVREAIRKATDAGDLKTVDALKKGLADFAQSSVQQFQQMAAQIKATYDGLKSQHQSLIDQMSNKEKEWSTQRQANEDLIYNAVNSTLARSMNSYQKYNQTLAEIERNRVEAQRLRDIGDQDSLQRAEELYKKNIQLDQSLKEVKLSTYDQLTQAEKNSIDQQIQDLQAISQKNGEQEATLQKLLGYKKDYATVVSAERAQQEALNQISTDANALQETQNQKEQTARDSYKEQLALLNSQMDTMKGMLTTVEGIMGAAKEQINFALNTDKADQQIQALLQARTMQVDVDLNSARTLLDQMLAPRTMQISLDVSGNLPGGASIPGKSSGGFMPGYGGGDRNLILTEDGEYVIKKEAVRFYGVDFIESVNSMRASLAKAGSNAWASQAAYNTYKSLSSSSSGIRGFREGGLVTGSAGIDDLVRAVTNLNEVVRDISDMSSKQTSNVEDRVDRSESNITNKLTNGLDNLRAEVQAVAAIFNKDFNIDVAVKSDGTGQATAGQWGQRR